MRRLVEHLEQPGLTKEILRDRDVVLYCSNEATSARVALLPRAKGITRVRPLKDSLRSEWTSISR